MSKQKSSQISTPADIDRLIGKMTLEEKVGQLFTLGFSGGVINPLVIKMVKEFHCGGLRITPNYIASYKKYKKVGESMQSEEGKGDRKQDVMPGTSVHLSAAAHVEVLNELQEMAAQRRVGLPLHVSADSEGGVSGDIMRGGYPLYPSAMGLACAKDEKLIFRVAKALAQQYRASGVTNIHSPVLDINCNPLNPEINVRSYGDTPQIVAKYSKAAMRGFMAGGLVPTAKHFPGRGDSNQDAHYDLPVLLHSREHLMKNELLPYKILIEAGLPSIMLAHQIAPALGDDKLPATVSRIIIQEIIRKELGFKGVITTDSITMEGILKIYPEEEASARAIAAGVDLVLFKNEDYDSVAKTLRKTADFVKQGIISEKELDASVRRVLLMKLDFDLFKTQGQCNPEKIERMIKSKDIKKLELEAAKKATLLVRDRKKLLPIKRSAKVLVVEQSMFFGRYCNEEHYHPYMHWDIIRKYAQTVDLYKLDFTGSESDLTEVLKLAKEYDVIVATNLYNRGAVPNTEFVDKLAKSIKNLVVITTTPYPFTVTDQMDCVLCNFSKFTPSIIASADILFGKAKAGKTWPVKYRPGK